MWGFRDDNGSDFMLNSSPTFFSVLNETAEAVGVERLFAMFFEGWGVVYFFFADNLLLIFICVGEPSVSERENKSATKP